MSKHLHEGWHEWLFGKPKPIPKTEIHYNHEMKLFHGHLEGEAFPPMSKKKFYGYLLARGLPHKDANALITHLTNAHKNSYHIKQFLKVAGRHIHYAHNTKDKKKSEKLWQSAEQWFRKAESLGWDRKTLKPEDLEESIVSEQKHKKLRQIIESKPPRTPEKMEKLIGYLKWGGTIAHKKYQDYPAEADGGELKREEDFTHEVKRIPLKHIERTQETVEPYKVLQYARDMYHNKFMENEERARIHLLKVGENRYQIVNGHHRLLAAQLNRKPDILSLVSEPKKT